MASRMYYLQLPEEAVPQALFEQVVRARRTEVVFESETGHNYRIRVVDDPNVRLYSLNLSLDQMSVDLTSLVAECLRTRAELTGLASHVGLVLEVPTVTNGKSWADLGAAIHDRIHQAMELEIYECNQAEESVASEFGCCDCGFVNEEQNGHHPGIRCPESGRCGQCGNKWPCSEHLHLVPKVDVTLCKPTATSSKKSQKKG